MAFFKRMINIIAKHVPIVKTNNKMAVTLPGVIVGNKNMSEGLKVHEQTHVKQQIKDPLFFARYALDKSYRWRMEKEAVTAHFQYCVDKKIPFDFDGISISLQKNYHNMASQSEIQQFINQLRSRMFINIPISG